MICDATTFAELAFRPDLDSFWPASTLDLEPEQCWCLSCGAKMPCDCAGQPLVAQALSGERVV